MRRRLTAQPSISAWERSSTSCWQRGEGAGESEEKACNNEKGPGNRGLGVESICPCSGRPQLLLFLWSSFLLRGFLGCGLHRLILPKHQILRLENRNVIHI